MNREQRLEQLASGVKLQITKSDMIPGVEHWTASLHTKDQLITTQGKSPELVVYQLAARVADWIIGMD
jgi:hypothetical protein